jgi:hypothetical protein
VTRVLIIVQNLPVPFDRRVWLECQALISDGYQVAVVFPKGNGDPADQVLKTIELYKYQPYARRYVNILQQSIKPLLKSSAREEDQWPPR